MLPQKIWLTELGYEKLVDELKALETTFQPKNNERIKRARNFCDFHEDSEFAAALREQVTIMNRIRELQHILRHAKIVQSSSGTEINLGSEVELIDVETDERTTYTIVSSEEVELHESAISVESPLGKALLGKEAGVEVTFRTPTGKRTVKINSIV